MKVARNKLDYIRKLIDSIEIQSHKDKKMNEIELKFGQTVKVSLFF